MHIKYLGTMIYKYAIEWNIKNILIYITMYSDFHLPI